MFETVRTVTVHVDGGANAHIFRDQIKSWKYIPSEITIQYVTGKSAPVEGIEIVIIMGDTHVIQLLYPYHHMLHNLQDTSGLPFSNMAKCKQYDSKHCHGSNLWVRKKW